MGKVRHTIARVLAMATRNRRDEELAEEVRLHLELRERALIDSGVDPSVAAREARRAFGNVTAVRERTRDMWGFAPVETLLQDVRYGVRTLRRTPVFTAVAVLSLAIGIGSAAAVFMLFDTVLFRTLPVRAPDELVVLRWRSGTVLPFESLRGNGSQTATETSSTSFSLPAFRAFREHAARYADAFGFADLYSVNLTVDNRPESGSGQAVSANYFDVLGVRPVLGRPFVEGDDRKGAPGVAVISYAYWIRRFAGSHDAVGRSVLVNAVPFTIVGITPRGFGGTLQVGQEPDVTIPLAAYESVTPDVNTENPNIWWVLVMARLRPGVSAAAASAPLDALLKGSVRAARPALPPDDLPAVQLLPGRRGQLETRSGMVEPLTIMAAVVAVVLLVACANVGNLLLARGRARVREIAVRVAIGASRRRVMRQLLTEGVLLAAVGCVLGVVLARWIFAALIPALGLTAMENHAVVWLQWRPLAFTAALTAFCALLFGLVPALRATDVRVAARLQEATRGSVGHRPRAGFTGSLVSIQVALSTLLLVVAGLLVQSVRGLQHVPTGFDPAHVLIFGVGAASNGYDAERTRTLLSRALDRLRALPGIQNVSLSSHRLIAGSSSIRVASRPDEPRPKAGTAEARAFGRTHSTWQLTIDGGFFGTMGIPILQGRSFTPADGATAPKVAVVNAKLAQQLFGSPNEAVGRRFRLGLDPAAPDYEVVGIAADARYTSLRRDPPPTAYLHYLQQAMSEATFELKTNTSPEALAESVREAMREIDSTLPLTDMRTQQAQILQSVRRERMFAGLATLLGGVTLLLAGIGLYGLLTYAVTARTPEIGVRMALGAERRAVRWMVLRQSLMLVAAGLALGIPVAAAGRGLIESLLFGLAPTDFRALAGAAIVMIGASFVAAWIPARRASRVDPLVALRALD